MIVVKPLGSTFLPSLSAPVPSLPPSLAAGQQQLVQTDMAAASGTMLSLISPLLKTSTQLGISTPPTQSVPVVPSALVPSQTTTAVQNSSIVSSILPSVLMPMISPIMATKTQALATSASTVSPVQTMDPFSLFQSVAAGSGGAPSAYTPQTSMDKSIQAGGKLPSSLDPGSITQALPQQPPMTPPVMLNDTSGNVPDAYSPNAYMDPRMLQAYSDSLKAPQGVTANGPPGPGSVATHDDPGTLGPTDQAALDKAHADVAADAGAVAAAIQKQSFSCFGTWWCPAIIVGGLLAVGYMVLKK